MRYDCEQGSEEWFNLRLGKVTASKVGDIMAKTKSGYSTSRANYMEVLLKERLDGTRLPSFTNEHMERGITLEPVARFAYESMTNLMVDKIGFIEHDELAFGGSPDGMVGNNSIEIKCPTAYNHRVTIKSNAVPSQYYWQIMAQMELTGGDWVDFISFNNQVKESRQIKVIRVFRDKTAIKEMLAEIEKFLLELDDLVKEENEDKQDINNEYLKLIGVAT